MVKLNPKWATRFFIAAIVGARIAMGLFFNVTGPTLPTLANNCGVTVSTVSWIFTVRSVAFFIGAASATKLFKYFNPLILVSGSVFGLGICLMFIPVVVDFWLLCILILLPGICAGIIDAGLQSILLEVWGPEKSRPLIQSFHFMYTIGAFLAPVIMGPFLALANDGEGTTETPCPGEPSNDDPTEISPESKMYIFYGFLVTSGFSLIVGCFWVYLTIVDVLSQIKTEHQDSSDTRPEEKVSTVWPFLIAVFCFFFFIETSEVIYATYIYDYARCSEYMNFDQAAGSTLTALFWGMMMFGRFIGIFIAKYITPTQYAYIDMVVGSIVIVLLAIKPIAGNELTYTVTAIFGLAISTIYGNGVLMTAKRMNVSDRYMWIFFFSAQLIPMFNPVLCSYLMEIDTEIFVYMNIFTTILGLLFIPIFTRSFKWVRSQGKLRWNPENPIKEESLNHSKEDISITAM